MRVQRYALVRKKWGVKMTTGEKEERGGGEVIIGERVVWVKRWVLVKGYMGLQKSVSIGGCGAYVCSGERGLQSSCKSRVCIGEK